MVFEQKVIWMGTVLGDASVEDFESFFLNDLGYRVRFEDEFKLVDGEFKDLSCIIFSICSRDIPKFALFRLTTPDMKWWEDFKDNYGVDNIPYNILELYN